MELVHQIFPSWHIYLDMFLVGFATYGFLRIKKKVRVEEGEKFAEFKPYNGYRISFEIDFDHPMIKSKLTKLSVDFSTLTFLKEISRARTFGFLKEIETLR